MTKFTLYKKRRDSHRQINIINVVVTKHITRANGNQRAPFLYQIKK
jgi:hypothetical protein